MSNYTKTVPCSDCGREMDKLRNTRVGGQALYTVKGCEPGGAEGMCVISYSDAGTAAAPIVAPAGFAGRALPLSPPAMQQVLAELDVPAEALWAVLKVETAGCGFLADRRPVILFERHKFSERTQHRFDAQAPDISNRERGGYVGGPGEYGRLERAIALDRKAALESTSWGLGQVMGFNAQAAGHPDVESLVRASAEGEDGQLRAMARFIAANSLAGPMREGNWKAVARSYNGESYADNDYDGKLAQWCARFVASGVPDVALRAAQLGLFILGYLAKGGVDGVFGQKTGEALRKFRQQEGLAGGTGKLDEPTLLAIGARALW